MRAPSRFASDCAVSIDAECHAARRETAQEHGDQSVSREFTSRISFKDPEFFGQDRATQMSEFARTLSLGDYFDVTRLAFADHAFWRILLPSAPRGSTCLVLESRLGIISEALSGTFSRVISLHATSEAAAVTRARVRTSGRSNVLVEIAPSMSTHIETSTGLSAIVIYDLEGDVTGQWSRTGRRATEDLLAASPRMLAPYGTVVIAANNEGSYVRIRERLGFGRCVRSFWHSIRGIRRALKGAGLEASSWFVSRARLRAPLEVSTEFRAVGVVGGTRPVKGNGTMSMRDRLLGSSVGFGLWPSFLVIASVGKVCRSELEERLDRVVVREAEPVRPEAVTTKRLIVGNQETLIVIAGTAAGTRGDVVVKIPTNETGWQLAKVNASTLDFLRETRLCALVPRRLPSGVRLPEGATVESLGAGSNAIRLLGVGKRTIESAFDALRLMNEVLAGSDTIDEADYDAGISDAIGFVGSICPAEIRLELEILDARLRAILVGARTQIGMIHGDYKIGNLLFDAAQRVTTIIDWDNARRGFAVFDLLHLIHFGIDARDRRRSYVDSILPWRLPSPWREPAHRLVVTMDMSAQVFLALRIGYYFAFLRDRINRSLAAHPAWSETLVSPVIDPIKRELASIMYERGSGADAKRTPGDGRN